MEKSEAKLLSLDILLKSLKKFTAREDVLICSDAKVSRATPGVQGFLSIVLRVQVHYRFQDDLKILAKTFIIKRFPTSDMLTQFSRQTGIFIREGTFFDRVVPIMKRLSRGEVNLPLPECYLANFGGSNDAIVMEDLTESGYETPNPRYISEGLSLDHCLVALKRLGQLHALSVAVERSLDPVSGGWLGAFPTFSNEVCFYEPSSDKHPSALTGLMDNAIQNILILSKEIEGLPKDAEASGKLGIVLLNSLWSKLCRSVRPDARGRNVPCHGDCWMNNLMFRYDKDRRPLDAKFIDFQVTRYCHPGIDILYFLYLSTTKSFREINIDDLLKAYHSSLTITLRTVSGGPPPISLEELREDVNGIYKPFGVIIGATLKPFFMLGQDLMQEDQGPVATETVDELLRTGNAVLLRDRFYRNRNFRRNVEEAIRELVEVTFPEGFQSELTSPLMV